MEQGRFPNKLKQYRRLFGLQQKQVAWILGLKEASPISRWEKGISLPSIGQLFQLSKLYKALPNALYFELWKDVSAQVETKEQDLLSSSESIISYE